jgi:hypothetical protein
MKALTIWQPWASLIMIGAKPYEFRGWRPPHWLIGQRLAIHAGARPVKRAEVWALLECLQDATAVRPCLHADIAKPALEKVFENPRLLPLAHVLCTAIVGEPVSGDACAREFGVDLGFLSGNDSDRANIFNWGWPLGDVEPVVPPVPWRGSQGLFDVPDDVVRVSA